MTHNPAEHHVSNESRADHSLASGEKWRPPPLGDGAQTAGKPPLNSRPILRLLVIALVIAAVVAGANWEKISLRFTRGQEARSVSSSADVSQIMSAPNTSLTDATSSLQKGSAVATATNRHLEQRQSTIPASPRASPITERSVTFPALNRDSINARAIRDTDLTKAASEETLKRLRQKQPQGNFGYFSADSRFGDITGDGVEEAAVWVRYRFSGEASTPSLSDVLVYALKDNNLTLLATFNGGDRAYGGIESVAIDAGKLMIGRYKPETPDACMACYGFIETTTYAWDGNELVGGRIEIKNYQAQAAQSLVPQPRKQTALTSPLVADVRHVLEQQMHEQSGGVIRLLSFEKTNGIERDLMGTRGYQIDYTAEVEFLEDCAWVAGGKWFGQNFAVIRERSRATSQMMELYDLEWVNKGSRRRFASSVMLERAEHGWRLSTFRHPLR